MLKQVYGTCYILPQRICLDGRVGIMCSTLDRFFGYCGYMPPTTKLALLSVVVAAFLAMVLARS